MGKNLVGNSLSYTIKQILLGDISIDDVKVIYAGTCIQGINEGNCENVEYAIRLYEDEWEKVAIELLAREIIERNHLKKSDIKLIRENRRIKLALGYLLDPHISAKTSKVCNRAIEIAKELVKSGKVIQTRYSSRYRTVTVKSTPEEQENGYPEEYKTQGNDRGEVACINGELYSDEKLYSYLNCGNEGKMFRDELELLANQLQYCSHPALDDIFEDLPKKGIPKKREFFMQKLFPQYEAEIKKVCEQINASERMWMEDEILGLFNQLLAEKKRKSQIEKMCANSPKKKYRGKNKRRERERAKKEYRQKLIAKGKKSLGELDSELTNLQATEQGAKELYMQYEQQLPEISQPEQ